MLYTITFNLALAVFILGIIYRCLRWVTVKVGPDADQFTVRTRLARALQGLISVAFSRHIFRLIGVFFCQGVLQGHILKKDPWRWLMHFSIFAGILLLVLFHALDGQITANLFSDYYSTVNPFLFLRNLFGAFVLLGIAIAGWRRLSSGELKKISTSQDLLALGLLALILFSGFLLEAGQIISEPVFNEMVEQYGDSDDQETLEALRTYWAKYYGVVFTDAPDLNEPDLIEAGREVHLESCASCHARPAAAFVSYPLSELIKPAGVRANSIRFDLILWQVHFLCCFAMLAYLPFSKFMHLFTSSVSLMLRSLENHGVLQPANRVTRRVVSLDACMNCGQCSLHCSVKPINRVLGNPNILPSYKLGALKKYVRKRWAPDLELSNFNEGSFICTECYRCTQVCPAGINLQDLWLTSKEDLASRGPSYPYQQVRSGLALKELPAQTNRKFSATARPESGRLEYAGSPDSFEACIQCGTCTNVCPVVADYQQDPQLMGFLDLTPQQIVNAYRLGITNRVLNSRMAWDCFMCFKCQEHCPKQIPVAEMMYELRNRGYKVVKESLEGSEVG